MKRGQRLTRDQMNKVERIFHQSPGLSAAEYISLIREEIGETLGIATVYRYMKKWNVPTPTQSSSARSVTSIDERETLRRLMEQMAAPELPEVSARWRLARGGVSVVKRRRGGELRLISDDGANVTGCWLSESERQFLEEVLRRADSARGTSLVASFRKLHEEAAALVNEALQLQRSMTANGEWRTMGATDQTPRQTRGRELRQELVDLQAKLEEFKSEARLITGA